MDFFFKFLLANGKLIHPSTGNIRSKLTVYIVCQNVILNEIYEMLPFLYREMCAMKRMSGY